MIPLQKLFSLGSSFEVIGISSTNTFIIPNRKNVFLEFLSMIESPALMTHGSVPSATRKMLGIDDNFVRISVGIEELDDLINDLS